MRIGFFYLLYYSVSFSQVSFLKNLFQKENNPVGAGMRRWFCEQVSCAMRY